MAVQLVHSVNSVPNLLAAGGFGSLAWGAELRSRSRRPDLGVLGNLIRSHPNLNTDYEKSLFEKYWLGQKGNIELTADQFKKVTDYVSSINSTSVLTVNSTNQTLIRKQFNFGRNPEFDYAFGTASVFYDISGNAVGFYDDYNFDIKWRGPSLNAVIPLIVRSACLIGGRCSPFEITYGQYVKP